MYAKLANLFHNKYPYQIGKDYYGYFLDAGASLEPTSSTTPTITQQLKL